MRNPLVLLLFVTLSAIELISNPRRPDTAYAGPDSLGPFRIDRGTTTAKMFQYVGEPKSQQSNHFCYTSAEPVTFMWLDRMAHEPSRVGDLLLSDFPNCIDRPRQSSIVPLASWKTEKGIGLRSAESQVVGAYGKPTMVDAIDATGYRWVIQGDHEAKATRPERGDRVLIYRGVDTLQTAEFGIRNGRVVWIFLSVNE